MIVKQAIIPSMNFTQHGFATSSTFPQEMLPLIDRPLIHYIIDEAVRSGIEQCIMVQAKPHIYFDEYFSQQPDAMASEESTAAHVAARTLGKKCDFSYIFAHAAQDLMQAVLAARHARSTDPIAFMLPSEVIINPIPALAQLIKIAQQEKCNVIAVREVPLETVHNYGIVRIKKQFSPTLFQVKELINKPSQTETPSNLAIVGRFVLSPTIFDIVNDNKNNTEMCFTDCIEELLAAGEKVYAYKISGLLYEAYDTMALLKSNITMALRHQLHADDMLNYLQELDREFLVMQGKAHMLGKKEKELRF